MDSMSAMLMGEKNRGKPMMVFDWHKAARRIRETGTRVASAGLRGDWKYTGGLIIKDGAPVPKEETYTYLASTWATPELDLDGTIEPCFVTEPEANGWGSNTYWPESALAILRGESAL